MHLTAVQAGLRTRHITIVAITAICRNSAHRYWDLEETDLETDLEEKCEKSTRKTGIGHHVIIISMAIIGGIQVRP